MIKKVRFSQLIKNQFKILCYILYKLFSNTQHNLVDVASKKTNIFKNITKVEFSIYSEENNLKRIPETLPKEIMDMTFWGDRTRGAVEKELNRDFISLKKSVLYELEDVILTKNALYCKNYRHILNKEVKFDLFLSPMSCSLEQAVLAHNYFSTRYWGHWIMSELPMQYFLRNEGTFVGSSSRESFRDEVYWKDILDIPNIEQEKIWNIKRLIMTDSVVMEPLIIKSWLDIRKRIVCKELKYRLVYIKRGNTGQERVLINEEEYISHLERIGFEIIDIMNTKGDQVIEILSTAAVVVGVEGSHMDPVLFTVDTGCLLIVLQPPCRVSLNTVTNSSICGVASSIYICEPDTEDSYFRFRVDIEDFLRFYDNVSKWARENMEGFTERVKKLERSFLL